MSDARNLRQSCTAGGATRQFTWSSVGGLPLLLDDGEHSYIYGASSTPLAQVDDVTGEVQYLHADLLGSPRLVTDSAGSQVGTVSFDAFGTVAAQSGVQSSFGFTGNWSDPDTGLLYLRARDYDPATGQFLTVDPLVDQTRQPYAYTRNSPVSRTDPTGLCPVNGGSDVADCRPEDFGGNSFLASPLGDVFADLTFDSPMAHIWWGIGDGATFGGTSDLMYGLTGQCMDSHKDGFYWGGVIGGVAGVTYASAGTVDAVGGARLYQQEQQAAARAAPSGWRLGQDINALTAAGNSPAWTTIRSRFWKNEALNPQYGTWDQANLDRMRRGLAPQRYNPDKNGIESMELSHEPIPYRDGGALVVPRWPQDHAAVDPYRRLNY